MKGKLLKAALGIALAGASASVFAGEGRFFVEADVGQSRVTRFEDLTDKTDTATAVNAGYRWSDTWGVELGYVDLGRWSNDYYNFKFSSTATTLGFNGKWNFAKDKFYATGRLGVMASKSKATMEWNFAPGYMAYINETSRDTNTYVGAGIGYNATYNFGVSLNLTSYQLKARDIATGEGRPWVASVGAEYRF